MRAHAFFIFQVVDFVHEKIIDDPAIFINIINNGGHKMRYIYEMIKKRVIDEKAILKSLLINIDDFFFKHIPCLI